MLGNRLHCHCLRVWARFQYRATLARMCHQRLWRNWPTMNITTFFTWDCRWYLKFCSLFSKWWTSNVSACIVTSSSWWQTRCTWYNYWDHWHLGVSPRRASCDCCAIWITYTSASPRKHRCMSPCHSSVWFISSIRAHCLWTPITLKFGGMGIRDVYIGLNNSSTYGITSQVQTGWWT